MSADRQSRLPPPEPGDSGGPEFVELGVILAGAVLVALVVLVVLRPQLAWIMSVVGSEVDKAGLVALSLA